MTKAELEAMVATLQAQLAALLAQINSTPDDVAAPAEVSPPVTEDEQWDADGYGPYNEHWCRAYKPLLDLLNDYENDGNRYHAFMVGELDKWQGGGGEIQEPHISPRVPEGTPDNGKYGYFPRDAVYLIKPKSGFVNKDHETFFLRAYNGNRNRSHYLPKGDNYFKGRVFTAFRKTTWQLLLPWAVGIGTDFVYGEECPFVGTAIPQPAESARERFEAYWTRAGIIKTNWKKTVAAVRKLDADYARDPTPERLAIMQKYTPHWRPEDGSPAVM